MNLRRRKKAVGKIKDKDRVKNETQMFEVINTEELANDRQARRGVVLAAKDLNGLYLVTKERKEKKAYCTIMLFLNRS